MSGTPIEMFLGRLIDRVTTEIPLFNSYITTTDDRYHYEYPIPGSTKNDVKIKVKGRYINIVCTRRNIDGDITKTYKYNCEIPDDGNVKDIVAKVSNGVLYVTIPKKFSDDESIDIDVI